MKIIGIVVAVILVMVGITINKLDIGDEGGNVESSDVLSEQTSPIEEPEISPTEIPEKMSPSISPTPTKVVMRTNIFDYRYPNSETLSSTQNALSLTSFDDPKTVTSWYKEKITAEGMNVKTFVETKTNDSVLNKLVGSSGQKEIRIEIKKDAGTSFVQIDVTLKTTS